MRYKHIPLNETEQLQLWADFAQVAITGLLSGRWSPNYKTAAASAAKVADAVMDDLDSRYRQSKSGERS